MTLLNGIMTDMCGIFGTIIKQDIPSVNSVFLKSLVNNLFKLSESRGKEAAGIAIFNNGGLRVHKEGVKPSLFIRGRIYNQLLTESFSGFGSSQGALAVIGHTRLATNGSQLDNHNNSPIVSGGVVGVHNGIVVNGDELLKSFPSMKKSGEVDSGLIFGILSLLIGEGLSLTKAATEVFKRIEGSASIAAISLDSYEVVLSTNTGSLYSCRPDTGGVHIFASEPYMLERLAKKLRLISLFGSYKISQLKPERGCIINTRDLREENFNLN